MRLPISFKEGDMPKVTISGLKDSTGSKPFEPLMGGRYKLKCTAVKVEESSKSPCDIFKFEFVVEKGPDKSDGSPSKGNRFFENVAIMRLEHPSFAKYGNIGVDSLKSMCLCFGVAPKGDSIDYEAFIGLSGEADIIRKLEKNQETDEEIVRNRVNKWVVG